jgi:hypothetical protein
MIRIRPKNWWQTGLMWGTAMFVWYLITDLRHGELTLPRVGKEFLIWESGGLLFGILLALVLSMLSRSNQFRSREEGDR